MNGDEQHSSFSLARRWGAGLNLIITIVAVLAIVAMANYLAMRHFKRVNWTRNSETELSARTRHVLASLTNSVKIIAYYDSEDTLFPRVRALLREYENASGGKIIFQHVDYTRQPAAANAIKTTYHLPDGTRDVVIFDGLRKVWVSSSALSDYDTSELMSGKSHEVQRTHFKGEMVFTSKIFECSSARSPKAYFLYGNFEHQLTETAGDSYSKFATILKNENNFEFQQLDLMAQKEVPTDCNLLIIAGPLQTLDDAEVDRIARYLDGGGRLLVLFREGNLETGRPTGLEKLLATWGVEVGSKIVLDPENSTSAGGASPVPVVLGSHPIVNSLGSNHIVFVLPRSMHAIRGSVRRREETKVDELCFTGPKSITAENVRAKNLQPAGAQPLVVAVEKSIPALERGTTRIVALGDSIIWSNQGIDSESNREFAEMTVNWLVQQNILLSEIPRWPIRTYKLAMTQSQLGTSRLLLLAVMPATVLFIGFVVWIRRRN